MSPRAYVAWIVGGCVGTLAPVLVLNLLLIGNDYRFDKNRLASAWQQETRGVTYAPPISQNRSFKTLRLNDRLRDINALVFGSSTMMGMTAEAWPSALLPYNFAQSGNSLQAVIGEAEYALTQWGARLRVVVIPLDWSVGFIYLAGEPPPTDLSVTRVMPAVAPSLAAQLREGLSLPRLRTLAGVLRDTVLTLRSATAARPFFTGPAGAPYRCADGTPARDYDLLFRGHCVGFRYDGSATFADQKRVTAAEAPGALARAASASSQYAKALARTAGEPDAKMLARIAALVASARTRGTRVILLLPPLLPALDARLDASPHSGRHLQRTKSVLQAWAKQHEIILFDAGRSEQFGCTATEFIDAHHALPGCYQKVMSAFFAGTAAMTQLRP